MSDEMSVGDGVSPSTQIDRCMCFATWSLYNGRHTARCFLTDSDIRQQPGQRQSLRTNPTQYPTRNQAIQDNILCISKL